MKVLFVVKHSGSVRNFESVVRLLAERGHQVHVASAGREEGLPGVLEDLCREHATISYGPAPMPKGLWGLMTQEIRLAIDFLRYLEPRYAMASKLRARAAEQAAPAVRAIAAWPAIRTPNGARALKRLLQAVERALPPSPQVGAFLRQQRPDILLVTPLVGLGSRQADYVRAARRLGVPTALCVHSWDNLTNKGLIRDVPDLITVWNDAQKREAVELHDVPASRVVVTGASSYDHWFGWVPGRRAEFCSRVGLPEDRPLLLYLCSSQFIAPVEAPFVRDWIERVRASGRPGLADAAILIRPHPQNAEQWQDAEFAGLGPVVIWPRGGADPVDRSSKADYYDSIHHSAAVVGVNTSGLIESAIVGRPVYTWLREEFRATQEGTLHFHHLLEADGGLLHVATSFEEHAAQLARALEGGPGLAERSRAFVERFVRPFGLSETSTPRVVDAIEATAVRQRVPERPPAAWSFGVRLALHPLAVRVNRSRAFERAERADRRLRRHEAAGAAVAHASPRSESTPATSAGDAVEAALMAVAEVARAGVPVLAGPFLGEVGYELLYWMPFLARAVTEHPGLRDRLIVVTRGGAGCWYPHVAARHVDVFEYVDIDGYRQAREAMAREVGRGQKQLGVSEFERGLLDRIRDDRGLRDAAVLHPSVMYEAYWQLLKKKALHNSWAALADYHPFDPPSSTQFTEKLPTDFVAVRFYFNPSFPDTADNRAFIASTVEGLAETTSVVLLNPALNLDDHRDVESSRSDRVHAIDRLMTPRDNLAVQTAVLSRARAFVGTYGGLAYLAPFLRVPSLSFYSDPTRFRQHHLELAQRVFREPPWGRFAALDVAQGDLLRAAFQRSAAPTPL